MPVPCADTCEGEVCISATDGVVELSGTWVPGVTLDRRPTKEAEESHQRLGSRSCTVRHVLCTQTR
jgi:hypothetical protein